MSLLRIIGERQSPEAVREFVAQLTTPSFNKPIDEHICLQHGSIRMVKNALWVFEKCFSIKLDFLPRSDGLLFRFSSMAREGNRDIEHGVACSLSQGLLLYNVIYKRFDVNSKQLIEDYSSEHMLTKLPLEQPAALIITHECGKLYAKPKLHINGKQLNQVIELPKVKNSNLEIEYFKDMNCQVNHIILHNEPIDLSKQQNFQYCILPQKAINNRLRDTNGRTVYEISNYRMVLHASGIELLPYGGIQSLVPLFRFVNDELTLITLFKILTLSSSQWINRQQLVQLNLFQQIAQLIQMPIPNQCFDWIKQIHDPYLISAVLKMLFDINFVTQVQDLHLYCITLQQFYFNNPVVSFSAFGIPKLAEFLVFQSSNEFVQDQLLQIMIFGCQYDLKLMKNHFALFLKIAQASQIVLKLKTLQSAQRLVVDLFKSDYDSFVEFRQHNLRKAILHDFLCLLQTDFEEVALLVLSIIQNFLRDAAEFLDMGMIQYMSKVVTIQESLDEYIKTIVRFMQLNKDSVSLIIHLYEKTKSEKVLQALVKFVENTVDYKSLFLNCAFQLLDFIAQSQNEQLVSVFVKLANRSIDQLKLLLVWMEFRQTTLILEPIMKYIITTYDDFDLFRIQNLIFFIHICVQPLSNMEEFMFKVTAGALRCDSDIALQSFVSGHSYLHCLQQECKQLEKWQDLFVQLLEKIFELQTQESENFIVHLMQITKIEIVPEHILSQISVHDRPLFQFDYNAFDQENRLSKEEINKIIQLENKNKMEQSLVLGEISGVIAQRASNMQISLYKLYNRARKARKQFKILWHDLRLTFYCPRDCSFQVDHQVDQDTQFQENKYYELKIMKYMTKLYTKPFLKIRFKEQLVFSIEDKINLAQLTQIEVHQVKSLYLRRCGLQFNEESIILNILSYNEESNHLTLLPHKLQEHQPFRMRWRVRDVVDVFERIYIRNRNAIEIIFKSGEQLYIIFSDEQTKIGFLTFLNYQKEQPDFNKASNLKYLMQVNFISCRSYIDLTRYPVFPWVLKGDASDFDDTDLHSILNENNFRKLALPIGACGNERRLKQFEKRFENEQFYYGTHYSSQALISQYLLRLQPFTQAAILIQDGKFDIPDRLYRSVVKSWMDCTEEMADVRELTPEFFSLPEIFLNINGLDLGRLQSGHQVNNVLLPFHSNKNPFYYVCQNYLALERPNCPIHEWIDLIWGYKQQGEEAIQAHNLFFPLTYSNFDTEKLDINEVAMEAQIAHFGQTPEQLFFKPHPQRQPQVSQQVNKVQKLKTSSPIVYLEQFAGKIVVIFADHLCQIYRVNLQKSLLSGIFALEKSISLQSLNFDPIVEYSKLPVVLLKDNLFVGGQINGKLIKASVEKANQSFIETFITDTCSCLATDECNLLLSGTIVGLVQAFDADGNLLKSLMHSNSQVNTLTVSQELTIFAVGTSSGEIFLYNLYNLRLYRKLVFEEGLKQVEICDNPIGCLIFMQGRDLLSYSLNGFYLARKRLASKFCQVMVVQERVNFLVRNLNRVGGDL